MSSLMSFVPSWHIWVLSIAAFLVPFLLSKIFARVHDFIKSGGNFKTASAPSPSSSSVERMPFSGDYAADIRSVLHVIGENSDLVIRKFPMSKLDAQGTLFYMDGMQQQRELNMRILEFFMFELTRDMLSIPFNGNGLLPFYTLKEATDAIEFSRLVLFGHAGVIVEGVPCGLLIQNPNTSNRAIVEPLSEALLRGPRLGFTEVLSENTSMLRRQGFSEQLEMRSYRIGNTLPKDVVIAYFKDIVNADLLKEVEARVSNIDIDFLADSGYIEQLIEDNYLSPFQQLQNTERPDRVINGLLEGRVAILQDGSPFALIAPATFSMLLQSPEDYYERWIPSSLLRMLRFFAAFLSLLAPSIYISFISFHPGLIPTELVLSIIETRQGVPFPSLIEVLILELAIEILREAGIRLPKPIGPAMGIVGGIIVGDAAVQAGIVSPILVIVVAVTAISSFSMPSYSAGITLRLLRFFGMIFAAILGMFGTILFFLLLCSHLSRLKSFGVSYLTPVSPYRLQDWKDLFIRAPISLMKKRPAMMKTRQERRQT
ncbi:spore germination protein [Paenibacillus brevis]|uniref:Spore germination protein n=1 Tax=Paenibacillus brevis TaxID=2841508 RepID=A0ABS6FKF4_9BACL|nr:spore germination protein [Paenibacillus brevis]MBU5670662.1 spore germination protein [Paenibacillus brevis]